jgi:hypothetical protein
MTGPERETALLRAQAAYFLVTGVWPLVDMRTFQAVTGPKLEHWLVKTVGATVAAAGASLLRAATQTPVRNETVVLGVGTSAALGAIDLWYVARRRISPVYLVDATVQAAIISAWVAARRHGGDGVRA